jgi:serine/threonine protein kinase
VPEGNELTINTAKHAFRISSAAIGKGGSFGQVHKATYTPINGDKGSNEQLECQVINIANAHGLESFCTECSILSQLAAPGHDNLVRFIDVQIDTVNGCAYMFIELCSGGDVLEALEKHGPMQEERVRELLKQLALAVQYLHSRGIVHNDIKLENLMLTASGNLKLVNLGLCQYIPRDADGNPELTTGGGGTPAYMRHERPLPGRHGAPYRADRADLWAVGVCLFQLLSGLMLLPSEQARKRVFGDLEAGVTACEAIYGKEGQLPFSDDARDVIDGLLRHEPSQRMTVEEVLRSNFLTRLAPTPAPLPTPPPVMPVLLPPGLPVPV